MIAVVFLIISNLEISNLMICEKNINLTGAGVSTAEGAFQEVGQIYAANRSTVLGLKLSFTFDSISISNVWPRVLKSSPDNKTAVFAFTDPPTGRILDSAAWVSVPLMAGCQGIIYNLPSVSNLKITFTLLAEIYSGNVTLWNDPQIVKLNPSSTLPAVPIVPVGRYEQSGDTLDYTKALSAFSPSWKVKFGQFDSPDFYGGICCNSSKWPTAVKLFGSRVNGLIGIVASIPYTIGYASSINSAMNNMSIASVSNLNGTFVYPNKIGVQSAMDYWVGRRNIIGSDLSGALSQYAYPVVVNYHLSFINTTDTSDLASVDCCTARELVGFILFLLQDETQNLIESKYHLVPISETLRTQVNNTIIQHLTCDGENLYESFLSTLDSKKDGMTTTSLVGILMGLLLVILVVLVKFHLHQRQKYLNSISSWLILPEKLKPLRETAPSPLGPVSNLSISHWTSYESGRHGHLDELSTFLLGDTVVFSWKLPQFDIKKMSLSTKKLLYQFQKEFGHENLLPFTGITVAEPKFLSLSSFNGKSTLHYLIHNHSYQLTDEIKYNFASDVVMGMKFLHSHQIPHRLLNSLSCYVDRSWRVKVGHWHFASLLQLENRQELRLMLTYSEIPSNRESLVRLLYLDPIAHKDFPFSYHADSYAFGILLFELFAQVLPFESEVDLQIETYADILKKKFILLEWPKPEIPPNVPTNIRQLIQNCLTDRANRIHFKAIETTINYCRTSTKGIIDLLMDSMESYMADLECKVAERTAGMTELNTKLQSLLNEVLPPEIASRLLKGEEIQPEYFESVSIYFSDIVGFTSLSSQSTPTEVMTFLNDLWMVFDKAVEMFDAYKVDTIGDAYMICSGAPRRNDFLHSCVIANVSLELMKRVKSFKIRHKPNEEVRIRIGINSGPVTAGIVGSKMPQYCIFGDTVNTASRMESSGKPMKIQVSQSTYELLTQHYSKEFKLSPRGEIEVKGKGVMLTYWLESPE